MLPKSIQHSFSQLGELSDQYRGVLAGLADPIAPDRTASALLLAYVFLWTIYGVVAKSSQDIHFDMGEALVWSHQTLLTTPKHPPLTAWVSGLWFSGLPRQDWAYYLLAMLCSSLGLWSSWQLSKEYLSGDKLPPAAVLLGFVPFFNFHALKFNANTIMIPLWGLATWTFVKSFRSHSLGWAALAGAASAAVMLGKYWGVFLLAGFAAAALSHPRRREYFTSLSPWVSAAVGFLLLAPHFASLAFRGFESFSYALSSHATTLATSLQSSLSFLLSTAGYLIIPILIGVIALQSNWRNALDVFSPSDPDRRFAVVIFATPILLPLVVAPLTSSALNALWVMGGFSLVPAILLSSPTTALSAKSTRIITRAAMIFPIAAVMLSPAVALVIHLKNPDPSQAHYQLLAREVEKIWAKESKSQLALVGGSTQLINGTAFYLKDVPATYDVVRPYHTPWASSALLEQGGVFVCENDDTLCLRNSEATVSSLSHSPPQTMEISRRFMGIQGARRRYSLLVVKGS